MTTEATLPSAAGERRPSSQEEQLLLIIDRTWAVFSAELGLSEMSLHDLAVGDPFCYAVSEPGHWQGRLKRWTSFAFVQQHASAFGRVTEHIASLRNRRAKRADLREALWSLSELRRSFPLWEQKQAWLGARQQLEAAAEHRIGIGR